MFTYMEEQIRTLCFGSLSLGSSDQFLNLFSDDLVSPLDIHGPKDFSVTVSLGEMMVSFQPKPRS